MFGKLFDEMSLTRFCLTLAQLLRAGVHMQEALLVTSPTVGNYQMERAILRARQAVLRSDYLAPTLGEESLFGTMVVRMTAVGEKSGNSSQLLQDVGNYHKRNVDEITARLSALIEPLFMAVVVGFIAIAMYLPYLKLTTLIK